MAIAELEAVSMPSRIKRLLRDQRGYPVPWFVHWVTPTQPDFRIVGRGKFAHAVKHKLCWVCGEPLFRNLAFVIGPMCAINRTTAELPTHRECGEYALRVCPFLVRSRMHRQERGLPEGATSPGVALQRNPGCGCLWVTRSYELFRVRGDGAGNPGVLVEIGPPIEVCWWREGRPATGVEVWQSIISGLPALIDLARQEKGAMQDLQAQLLAMAPLVPPAPGIDPPRLIEAVEAEMALSG